MTFPELNAAIDLAVNPHGGQPKITGPALNGLLRTLSSELAGGLASQPLLFQVPAPGEPSRLHLAVLDEAQARQLVQGEVSRVTVTTSEREGQAYRVTFGYEASRGTFRVLGLATVGSTLPPYLPNADGGVRQVGVDVGRFRGSYDEAQRPYRADDYVVQAGQLFRSLVAAPGSLPGTNTAEWEAVLSGGGGGAGLAAGTGAGSVVQASAGNQATNSFASALGYYTVANGYAAHTEGQWTNANGYASHAEGGYTYANGYTAHAEGSNTYANGQAAHAEGQSTRVYVDAAHAEGAYTSANNYAAHAEGQSTYASGRAAHAQGLSATAAGLAAHAEGIQTQASGSFAHAQGGSTQAQGAYSHGAGLLSRASGYAAEARGIGSYSRNATELALAGGLYYWSGDDYAAVPGQAQRTQRVMLARTYAQRPLAVFRNGLLNQAGPEETDLNGLPTPALDKLLFADHDLVQLTLQVICTTTRQDGSCLRANWHQQLLLDVAAQKVYNTSAYGSPPLDLDTELPPSSFIPSSPDGYYPRLRISLEGNEMQVAAYLEAGPADGATRWVMTVDCLSLLNEPDPTTGLLEVPAEVPTGRYHLATPHGQDYLASGSDGQPQLQLDVAGQPGRFLSADYSGINVLLPANAQGYLRLTTGSGTYFSREQVHTGAAPPLSVSGFDPLSLASNDYFYVQVSGEGLYATTGVTLNGVALDFNILSDNLLALYSNQADLLETGNLVITTFYGTVTTADKLTIVPVPIIQYYTVQDYSPGAVLTFTGQHLEQTTDISLRQYYTPSNTYPVAFTQTGNQLLLTLPNAPVSTFYFLDLISNGVTYYNMLLYLYPASVQLQSCTPSSGAAGDEFTLTGTHFEQVQQVYLSSAETGEQVIPILRSRTSSQFQLAVPVGIRPGDYYLILENPNGQNGTIVFYVVSGGPYPREFSPTTGDSGTEVTFKGEHLDAITAVAFVADYSDREMFSAKDDGEGEGEGDTAPGVAATITQQAADQLVLQVPTLANGSYRLRFTSELGSFDAGSFFVGGKVGIGSPPSTAATRM